MSRRMIVGLVVAVMITCVACGSEEPATTTSPPSSEGDLVAFCDSAKELDEAALSEAGHPSDAQLDRFLDNAPSDIKDDAEILVASARDFRSGNEEAASSDEIQEAADRFDDY